MLIWGKIVHGKKIQLILRQSKALGYIFSILTLTVYNDSFDVVVMAFICIMGVKFLCNYSNKRALAALQTKRTGKF